MYDPKQVECVEFNSFQHVSPEAVEKIVTKSKATTCSQDPIPTQLLKSCLPTLLPAITKIVNLSLTQGTFPSCWKEAVILPLLKKTGL